MSPGPAYGSTPGVNLHPLCQVREARNNQDCIAPGKLVILIRGSEIGYHAKGSSPWNAMSQ